MPIEKHWAVEADEAVSRLAEQTALLTLKGIGLNEQVKQLKKETNIEVTRTKLVQLRKHPRYHKVVKRDAEASIETGTLQARLGCIELIPDCLSALKEQIGKGNVKAIETTLKVAIGDTKKDAPEQQQAIQIIMASDTKSEKPV